MARATLLPLLVFLACQGGVKETGTSTTTSSSSVGVSLGSSTTGDTSTSTGDTSSSTTAAPCPEIDVTPGGRLGCDGIELLLGGECMQLAGVELCPDGSLHRHSAVPCNEIDAGHCINDAVCDDGEACLCELFFGPDDPAWYGLDVCVDAGCRTDDDCGGRRCGISIDMCWMVDGLYCHTPDDECEGPKDCPGVQARCAYSPEEARWVCGGFGACE